MLAHKGTTIGSPKFQKKPSSLRTSTMSNKRVSFATVADIRLLNSEIGNANVTPQSDSATPMPMRQPAENAVDMEQLLVPRFHGQARSELPSVAETEIENENDTATDMRMDFTCTVGGILDVDENTGPARYEDLTSTALAPMEFTQAQSKVLRDISNFDFTGTIIPHAMSSQDNLLLLSPVPGFKPVGTPTSNHTPQHRMTPATPRTPGEIFNAALVAATTTQVSPAVTVQQPSTPRSGWKEVQDNDVIMGEDMTDASIIEMGDVAPRSITFSEFCNLMGIRFLDDLSNNKRASMFPVHRFAPATSTKDFIRLACIVKPELEGFEKGCTDMMRETDELREQNACLEERVNTNNPPVFLLAQIADENTIQSLQQQMKSLKQVCKHESQVGKHQIITQVHTQIQNLMNEQLALLQKDHDKMSGNIQRLQKQSQQAISDHKRSKEARNMVEEKRRRVEALHVQLQQQREETQKMESTVCAESQALTQLQSRRTETQERISRLTEKLNANFHDIPSLDGTLNDATRSKRLHRDGDADWATCCEIRTALIELAGIRELVEGYHQHQNELFGQNSAATVLQNAHTNLERIDLLVEEIYAVTQTMHLMLEFRSSLRTPTSVPVSFVFSNPVVKFTVTLFLDLGYPFSALHWSFQKKWDRARKEFSITEHAIAKVIEHFSSSSFSRLSEICQELQELSQISRDRSPLPHH